MRRSSGAAAALAVAVAVGATSAAWGRLATLRPACPPVGNSCTVRIPITLSDNGVQVVITTPRKNHGALISDSNHSPFGAMYNVDETSSGMTFELRDVASVRPGTVLVITFKLDPVASSRPSGASSPAGATSPAASSGGGSVSVRGPATVKLGSAFTEAVSADATAPALFLVFEVPGATCAAAASEYSRSSERVRESVPAGAFDVTFHLVAEPAGTEALCVYLVNPSTGATESHGGAHWTSSS